jgi:sugar phosphate isomerase/epimerase
MTRREYIKHSALLALFAGMGIHDTFSLGKLKLKIGACDWSIGKSSDIGAFEVARQIGLSGIQVNMGSEKNDLHMRQPAMQKAYLEESKSTKIKIASLAIGELNNVPYKSDPRTEQWVEDSIDVAKALGVNVILLAFFSKNDLRNDTAGKEEVIQRLKRVAPKAEKLGITLGIESYLSAEEHLDIIQRVGSKSIKVYYDFRNSADAGYDVIKEIKLLGRDSICELHIKENGKLLGDGTLDWRQIGETLAHLDYKGDGWMQIEWSLPEGKPVVSGYQHNLQYLKTSFGIK